jgi:hypothetical protein
MTKRDWTTFYEKTRLAVQMALPGSAATDQEVERIAGLNIATIGLV